MSARELRQDDIRHLSTGANFVACAIDRDGCLFYRDLVIDRMEQGGAGPVLASIDEFAADSISTAVGFVNMGHMFMELIPIGDEFENAVALLRARLDVPVAGLYPLAAASVNAMVPAYVAMQTGLPLVDADPMGRVFPLLSQTTLTLAGLSAGPIGLSGSTGESAFVEVESPLRAERIVRALAAEFGGWAATASYPGPMSALERHGVIGSISRLIKIGRILDSGKYTQEKYAELTSLLGMRRVIRARVVEIEGQSGPMGAAMPDRPSSVTLVDEAQGRIIRLEIQNEIQMMLVDGAVQALIPDIITMTRPEDASVAGLEDFWVGNKLDLISFPAAAPWYTPSGRALVEPPGRPVPQDRRSGKAS